jgi:hypothetical protein
MVSLIRSVLLWERLNRSSLVREDLRSIGEWVTRTVHLTWSLLVRRSHVYLLLLLHLLRLAEASFNLLLLLHWHIVDDLLFIGHIAWHFSGLSRGSCIGIALRFIELCTWRGILLLETTKVGTYVKSWLRSYLLLLVERYLMVELLQQQFWIV